MLDLLIQPKVLDQASQNALLKSLFPTERVKGSLVLTVISSLGPGKQRPSSTTQSALLKWLVLVSDAIDPPSVLSSCYGVLFNLLNVLYLRTYLCHLIAKITRRKHVKPFRIENLKKIEQGITRDASITKLVQVFEFLFPVSFYVPTPRLPIVFSHPDVEWAETFSAIVRREGSDIGPTVIVTEDFKSGSRCQTGRPPRKAIEQSKSFVRPETLDDVVLKFETIKLDEASLADLADPLVQRYLSLLPENDAVEKITDPLSTTLNDELENRDQDEGLSQNFLEQLLQITRRDKVSRIAIVISECAHCNRNH